MRKTPRLKQLINHNYSTRSSTNEKNQIPKPTNSAFRKFIDYIGIQLYNLLPIHIRQIWCYKKFKIKSKIYVRDNIVEFKNIINN